MTDFKYKQTKVKGTVASIPKHYTEKVWWGGGKGVEVKFQALTSALDRKKRNECTRINNFVWVDLTLDLTNARSNQGASTQIASACCLPVRLTLRPRTWRQYILPIFRIVHRMLKNYSPLRSVCLHDSSPQPLDSRKGNLMWKVWAKTIRI
jgi:hypothetical protein